MMDESQVCGVCADFEPQAWRKSLCRNCFHSLDEHSEEMLAAEAEAAAKEKTEDKTSVKTEDSKLKNEPKKAPGIDGKDIRTKSKTPPIPLSKPSQTAPRAGVKSKEQVTSLSSSTTTTTTTSTSSSSSHLPKSSLKMPAIGTSKTSLSSSTSTTSSSASSSSTSSTTTTTSSSSASGPRTSSKPSQSIPAPAPAPSTSKAKSLTSKFENKTLEAKESKPISKTPPSAGLKSKTVDSSETVKAEETNSKPSASTSSRFESGNDIKKIADDKSPKSEDSLEKDKISESKIPGKGKNEAKIPVGRTKNVAPFGKAMLKSTKDALKKEKEKSSSELPNITHSNIKESEQDQKSKFDSLKRGFTAKDTYVGDDKKKTVTESSTKLESADKATAITSPSETKVGVGVNTPGKVGSSTTQRVDGTDKFHEDHGNSRGAREIDKSGTGKINDVSGQTSKPTSNARFEKEAEKRHGEDEKGDNLKQRQEKTGTTGEREGKGTPVSKWQTGAKGKFHSGQDAAAPEPPTKKGLSGVDENSWDLASQKDSGKDTKKTENQSVTPASKVVSPLTTATTSTTSTTKTSALTSTSTTSSVPSPKLTSSSSSSSLPSPKSAASGKLENVEKEPSLPTAASSHGRADDKTAKKLSEELKKKEEKVALLENKLSKMEKKLKGLEQEREAAPKAASTTKEQKDEMEKLLKCLRDQVTQMEEQCTKLEKDNSTLKESLQEQEKSVKRDQASRGKTTDNVDLERDLERTEDELDEVKEENSELRQEIMDMKNEMDEMYDTFRENEHDEFRELQKELDMTAKNCRILQFKLRKAERRNEQIEEDRVHYEEKLRQLQDQFDSADAKNHIRILEEELRVAKEVSVRLHDELDIIEDKKNKAVEDNKHLTELLEHTDKRQFRMEMEIDKLRELVADLKQQLKEEKSKSGNNVNNCNNNNDSNKEASPERKMAAGSLSSQTSRENQDYDVSQLMKDLCDSMERENDLKDQLKFTEEEAKMMRRRVSEMDEENENLRLQLKKMSEKASKHKKQEQKRVKELEEERKASEAVKAALTRQQGVSTDVVVVLGAQDCDVMTGDEPIPITERKDSTDEDLMNVMQLRVQLEMLDQELIASHKKLDEMDLENENLHDEVKFLQERLEEKEKSQDSNLRPPEPSSPNAYYEDRIKELIQDVDELRWKLIEKDREIERLSVVQTRHSRDPHTKRSERLKKSKSLDNDNDPEIKDLRKQLEQLQMENIRWKKQVEETEERNEELTKQIADQINKPVLPQVEADDAAIENIDLKDQVKKMDSELKEKSEKIRLLTDDLQKLSRDTRTFQNIATSPMTPGSSDILNIPPSWPESLGARAKTSAANQLEESTSHDAATRLLALQQENLELRQLMAAFRLQEPRGVADGSSSAQSALSSRATANSSIEGIPPAGISELSLISSKECEDHEGNVILLQNSTSESRSPQIRNENILETSSGQPIQQTSTGTESSSRTVSLSHSNNESPEVINKENKTAKGLVSTSPTTPSDMATVAKEGDTGHTSTVDDGGGGGGGAHSDDIGVEEAKTPRTRSEDEDKGRLSILTKYPHGKSKVVVTGEESRVELMEKILDMDEEIGDLISCIRKREDDFSRMCRDMKVMKVQMHELKDESRRNERDLLQELDMLHDKNTVMSNLLDIINERAEAAEEELERRIQEGGTTSPPRSASNVSQVSALSDTSMGSDEVFLNAHGNKEGAITRDWEAKLKTRIESLERLLAEERQKVVTAEKKLTLSNIEAISPSVSDDVKLRMREKELLQEELLESQRHLHIATDQLQGLRERLQIVEEEHHRLKMDYGKLYDEIDKPLEKEMERKGDEESDSREGETTSASDSDKTPENSVDAEHPFLTKKISVVEAPTFRELTKANQTPDAEVENLKAELAKYRYKCEELEYKVEEINDIWRSKSAASDREKDDFEAQVKQKIREVSLANETLGSLKHNLCSKDKLIAEFEIKLKEKARELDRKSEAIKDQESEIKKYDQDRKLFLTQISQRDNSIRGLNDIIRVRDERLKEKDDILFKLNSSIDEIKTRLQTSEERNADLTSRVDEKEDIISRIRNQAPCPPQSQEERTCHTDAEKEYTRLNESHKQLQETLNKSTIENKKLEDIVEQSRKTMNESMVLWKNEKAAMQRDMNVMEEKVRMYEVYNTQGQGEAIESLKKEAHEYFREKEYLKLQLESVEVKAEADDRTHSSQVTRLQNDLTEKLRYLKNEVDKNTRLTLENERLNVQAEKAYRYQQEERMLKAEYQALKVRYETRFDKMYKEFNKMVATIETQQKEKEKDQELIQALTKSMNLLKDKYTDELLRAEDDKATLGKQMKETEELRGHLDGLMKIVRELQDKLTDQERLRTELINKMATDKASWEIERANLNSQVNQLEEQLSSSNRQQNRAKDIEVNMAITWEKERKEQKRLLAEAHTLALDLQAQLTSRDEAFSHERKELLRQMEGDRLSWTKEKRETERKVTQFESNARKLNALQKRVTESQETLEKENQQWRQERKELMDQLSQAKTTHAKDCKHIEDVLVGLAQLRELEPILEPSGSSSSDLDEKFILHVRQAVAQINKAAEELGGPFTDGQAHSDSERMEIQPSSGKPPDEERRKSDDVITIVPSTSMPSEKPIKSSKQQVMQQSPNVSKTTPKSALKSTTSSTIAASIEKLQTPKAAKPSSLGLGKTPATGSKQPSTSNDKGSAISSKNASKSTKSDHGFDTHSWPRKTKPDSQQSAPVIMRSYDTYSRRYDRPPSYTSGTRSAQSSRAATPEITESTNSSLEFTPSKKSGLPDPPPCIILSHHRRSVSPSQTSPSPVQSAGNSSMTASGKPNAKRPARFGKSLSIDSSDILDSDSPHRLATRTSNSAASTPTQEVVILESLPPFQVLPEANLLSVETSESSSRNKKYSPRTARKMFFAETPPTSPEQQDILSWPERKSTTSLQRPPQLPDPIELRREAEEEYTSLSSKAEAATDPQQSVRTSVSWDETVHFRVVNDPNARDPSSGVICSTSENPELGNRTSVGSIPEDAILPSSATPAMAAAPTTKSAKEKRKIFKKSGSLDSTVGSSIAKMGVSAMPMAAPTGFTPYDFFAAVKGKLRPVFRHKSSDSKTKDQEGRSPSPLFIPTEVPDINFGSSGSTLLPIPVPQVNFCQLEQEEEEESMQGHMTSRSRHFHREGQGQHDKLWRSKSADRAAPPSRIHHTHNMGSSQEIWKFNETDL